MENREIEDLKLQISRLQAVNEIRNIMGRYEAYRFTRKEIVNTTELLATWRPDCSVEEGAHGVAMGTEAAVKRWASVRPGNLHAACTLNLASTPTIEVAGNGMTAKAIFISFGLGTGLISLEERKTIEKWGLGKYAIDFIKNPETGQWGIWHLHWYRIILSDFDKGFVQALFDDDKREEMSRIPGRLESQFHRSLSLYEDTHPFPLPPKPYYDYDGDFRWQYGGEEKEKEYGVEYKHYEKLYNVDYPNHI